MYSFQTIYLSPARVSFIKMEVKCWSIFCQFDIKNNLLYSLEIRKNIQFYMVNILLNDR